MCRGQKPPPFKDTFKAVPVFVHAILTESNPEVIIDSCWALSYLC